MTREDKVIAIVLIVWLAVSVGFLIGAAWATRKPAPPMPVQPPVRVVQAIREREVLVRVRDFVPHREDFDPSARAVIDEIVERHKW